MPFSATGSAAGCFIVIAGAIASTSRFISSLITIGSGSASISCSDAKSSAGIASSTGVGTTTGSSSGFGSGFGCATGAVAPNVKTILDVLVMASVASAPYQSINTGRFFVAIGAVGAYSKKISHATVGPILRIFLHVSRSISPLISSCVRTSAIIASAVAETLTVSVFFWPTITSDQYTISGAIFISAGTVSSISDALLSSPLNNSVNSINTTTNAAANSNHCTRFGVFCRSSEICSLSLLIP